MKLPIVLRSEHERAVANASGAFSYLEGQVQWLKRENRMSAASTIMLSIAVAMLVYRVYKLEKGA